MHAYTCMYVCEAESEIKDGVATKDKKTKTNGTVVQQLSNSQRFLIAFVVGILENFLIAN